jgi:hypothetical protein
MKKLTPAGGVLVLALLVALTGCSGSPAPTRAPVDQSASPAAAPARAASAPFDFSCAQSITATELAALGPSLEPDSELFNVLPPMPSENVTERIASAGQIDPLLAAIDQGYFDCTWGNKATGNLVRLSVLPDAEAAFDAHQASMTDRYTLQSFTRVNLGTAAYGGCGPDILGQDDRPICELNILSGSMWLAIALRAPSEYPANVQQTLTAAAGSALSAVVKAGSLPDAITPSAVWTAQCNTLGSIVPPPSPSVTNGSNGTETYLIDDDMDDPLLIAAILRSDASDCQTSTASVAVFPGNGTVTPISYPDGGPTPGVNLTIPGMRNARSVCNPAAGEGCWIEGSIGGAYVVANGVGAKNLLVQLIATRTQ